MLQPAHRRCKQVHAANALIDDVFVFGRQVSAALHKEQPDELKKKAEILFRWLEGERVDAGTTGPDALNRSTE